MAHSCRPTSTGDPPAPLGTEQVGVVSAAVAIFVPPVAMVVNVLALVSGGWYLGAKGDLLLRTRRRAVGPAQSGQTVIRNGLKRLV